MVTFVKEVATYLLNKYTIGVEDTFPRYTNIQSLCS